MDGDENEKRVISRPEYKVTIATMSLDSVLKLSMIIMIFCRAFDFIQVSGEEPNLLFSSFVFYVEDFLVVVLQF